MWCRKNNWHLAYSNEQESFFSFKDGGLHKRIIRIFILSKSISKVRISNFPGNLMLSITLKGVS